MLEGIAGLLLFAAAVYAIFQIVGSNAETLEKVLWVVGVLVLPFVGVVAWYFFGPGGQKG